MAQIRLAIPPYLWMYTGMKAPPLSSSDLASLRDTPITALRALWLEHLRTRAKPDPPRSKLLLLRELTWHMQAKEHGGIDAQTQRLLKEAVRQAGSSEGQDPSKPVRKARPSGVALAPGVTLIRQWGGREHRVIVIEPNRRYRYRSKEYRSLSQIAREITGAHWSGPRFFGLNRPRKPPEPIRKQPTD